MGRGGGEGERARWIEKSGRRRSAKRPMQIRSRQEREPGLDGKVFRHDWLATEPASSDPTGPARQ